MSDQRMGDRHPTELEAQRLLIAQLRAVHATKAAALRMFGPMLAAVRGERDRGSLPSVTDLLGRMHDAFGGHAEETERHERELRARLEALGHRPSKPLTAGLGAAATARAKLGGIRGQNHGANARDAFIFEHAEIASCELLERLATLAGDEATAELARACRKDDEEMAARIRRNWDNVLHLLLASQGVEPIRDPEPEATAETSDSVG